MAWHRDFRTSLGKRSLLRVANAETRGAHFQESEADKADMHILSSWISADRATTLYCTG